MYKLEVITSIGRIFILDEVFNSYDEAQLFSMLFKEKHFTCIGIDIIKI